MSVNQKGVLYKWDRYIYLNEMHSKNGTDTCIMYICKVHSKNGTDTCISVSYTQKIGQIIEYPYGTL